MVSRPAHPRPRSPPSTRPEPASRSTICSLPGFRSCCSTSSGCGPCSALLPAAAAWQAEHADHLTIALAHGSDLDSSRAEAQEHGLERVLVDEDLAVLESYRVSGTPGAVVVSPDGTVASRPAAGAEAIARLVESTLADAPESLDEGLSVGEPAPELDLVGVDGEAILFADPGEDTLVLFWNPGCGFCSSMRDEVLAWERQTPLGGPRLLVVSSGDPDSTRAEGFSSAVALDAAFAAGNAFGAGGTPMAVLVDRAGRIASPLAAGAEAVFELLGARGALSGRETAREHRAG